MSNLIFITFFISIKCLYQRFFVTCVTKSCEMRGGRIRVKGESLIGFEMEESEMVQIDSSYLE